MKLLLTFLLSLFALLAFGQPGNSPGFVTVGNVSIGCDTITGERVFYDIRNNKVCDCLAPDGDLLIERSCVNVLPGPCEYRPTECVESQEWTYGIDNTGTRFNDVADYIITLSDGSTLEFSQDGSSTNWTAQLTEWSNNIQAAADASGLSWLVEPRTVNNLNPTDISGNYGNSPTGLPGAPSVPVAVALINGGMGARYVNIQICPGQPVPVKAERISSRDFTTNPYTLTTAGAILGPIQKFFVCRDCGKEPVWYLEDGITLADAGRIPFCSEPCGTLTLADAPPDRDCEFQTTIGCDNNNSSNTVDFTNTITRRATLCNGEQITVDYFQEDPNDNSALSTYALVGDFVDCSTGQQVELPIPECSRFEITDLFKTEGVTETLRNREWNIGNAPATFITEAEGRAIRTNFDFTQTTTVDSDWNSLSVDDTSNDTDIQDIQVVEGSLVVEQPLLIRWRGASFGYFALEIGECCSDYKVVIEGASDDGTANPTPGYLLEPGIHTIRIWNIDDHTNTSRIFEYSLNGGVVWRGKGAVPGVSLSRAKPYEVCKKVKVCEDTGEIIAFSDDQPVDISEYRECAIECVPTSAAGSDTSGEITGTVSVDNFPEECAETEKPLTMVSGSNTSIPPGLKSVTINNISGVTTINGTKELGTGRRVDAISFETDRSNCSNEVLPAITITGGTWDWIGLRE